MREHKRIATASATSHRASILNQTLAAATRDVQTVTREGKPLAPMIEGVNLREVRTHSDARGTVVEIFDQRWGWHPTPISSLHCFTVRPGFVKGWGLHKNHEDRYMILQGEMELVLFDHDQRHQRVARSQRFRCPSIGDASSTSRLAFGTPITISEPRTLS